MSLIVVGKGGGDGGLEEHSLDPTDDRNWLSMAPIVWSLVAGSDWMGAEALRG